jgi:hypothetical protein
LAKTYPTPPATADIVFDGDEGRLTEDAFLRDFAGDLPEAKAKVLYAVQEPFHKALLAGKTTQAAYRRVRLSSLKRIRARTQARVGEDFYRLRAR